MKNYTYILECADGTFYCGWTNDIVRRIEAHNNGSGSKYTRARRPVRLVYLEESGTKEGALRREWEIKRLTRKEKQDLIRKNEKSAGA